MYSTRYRYLGTAVGPPGHAVVEEARPQLLEYCVKIGSTRFLSENSLHTTVGSVSCTTMAMMAAASMLRGLLP